MKKLVFGILMAFGLVSVSFGVDLYGNEENYQKLKAEMEMEESSWSERWQITCSWDEDGNVVTGGRGGVNNPYNSAKGWCELKNVLAFFDELQAMEVENDNLNLAIAKVREMPRFKNDDGIYIYVRGSRMDWKTKEEVAVFNDYGFWKRVFEKWKETKINLEMRKLY